MKNPPHPGLLVKDDIEALNLSVAGAAKAIGVTRQQMHNVLSGKSAISPEMALRLELGFGTSADTWLKMQAAFDLAQLRPGMPALGIKRVGTLAA